MQTPADVPTSVIRIEGMNCDHCIHAVKQALSLVHGLRVVSVTLGRAEVQGEGAAATAGALAAIEDAGFEAEIDSDSRT